LTGAIEVKETKDSDTIVEYFVKQIRMRKSLAFSITKELLYKLKSLCKMNSSNELREKILYDQGLEKIENELDIRNVAQKLRTLNFIAHVLLTKSQRRMIPYFKEHLLN
jgi:hypothetical protein